MTRLRYGFANRIVVKSSATVSGAPVAARTSSTVNPGAISRIRNPSPVGSNNP